VASRLSTVGKGVLDGMGDGVSDGRGVSVEASVGVVDTVSVGAGGVDVFVGGNVVFVDDVSTGIGVEVELQANEVSINKIGKKRFRPIG
jgi:hypothetical protein